MRGKGIYIFYNLLLVLLLPVIALYLLWRVLFLGKSRSGLGERLGFLPELPPEGRGRIWIHAVSAGEAVAARPILQELKARLPQCPLVLSATTPVGYAFARDSIKEADAVIYFPFDLPGIIGRALRRVRPRLVLAVETELWPNFFAVARSCGARTALVNGRIAAKSLAGARRFPAIYRWVLSNMDLCCMQSEEDAERVIALGADPRKVRVMGNTKFDQSLPGDAPERLADLRKALGIPEGTPVFVAGSTNEGEEEPVIEAFLAARRQMPKMRLVIAPRYIERAPEIAALLSAKGLESLRRSALSAEAPAPEGSAGVLLLDTFGELAIVYGLASVCFVGGSLIPKGGHSIIQPLAWGKPVLFGPHMFKSKEAAEMALRNGIGFQINSAAEMAEEIIRLASNPALLAEIDRKAREVMERSRGAAARCAEALAELLAGSER